MKMDWSGTGSLFVFIFLISSGIHSLKSPPSLGEGGGLSLPWHDTLCCDSPGAHLNAEEKPPEHKTSNESRPLLFTHCYFRSKHQHDFSGGLCVDVMCRIREDWSTLNCELHSDQSAFSRTPTAISFQPVSGAEGVSLSADPVICEGNSFLKCSLALGAISFDVTVTVTIGNSSSPVHLKVPTTPVKPGAPENLSHHQTTEGELVLTWVPPPGLWGQLRYEVRYSSNETEPAWKVLQAFGEPRMLLDLDANNYSLQIRCSNLVEPPVWSDWSQTHEIILDVITYLPEIAVTHPGEAVTIYCVFNDRDSQASSAQWTLNFQQRLPSSQYHPVNQRVSQITVTPSSKRMYELLQCTKKDHYSYSQIYVQGAAIDITCKTNGAINTMECSWKNEGWTDPIFKSKWADLLCEEMERREKEGEELGSPGPVCHNQRSCTLHSLRICHKLWLERDSSFGPIMSKPIYVSPVDHVKPHTPSNVRAVTLSSGVLSVTWDRPLLPVQGVQCNFRYHGPSTNGQPVWRVQPPVLINRDEVPIPNACVSYAVQVSCLPTHGTGYWSDWSETKYSAPQNSQAPEQGPDFWRVFSDDPNGNQTTVTLLFEHLQTSDLSYCVDGMKIKHQYLNGSVTETNLMGLKSSHTFEWNHEPQTVTVATYNSVGRSAKNFNITLNRQMKRRAVRSFHVFLVNSSCVSVSWSILESSSVPQSLVLQWTHSHPENHKSSVTWRRLSYNDPHVHIRGDFFSSEEYDFYLYPVFADGEGQPVHTRAVRKEPRVIMLLLIISFLSVVLLVTLVLSQNQVKKIVWKDVPNPNNCSWAKGVDFRKLDMGSTYDYIEMDTFDHLLRAPDALPACPLLLPAESISTVVIVDKTDPPALVQPSLDPAMSDITLNFDPQGNEKILSEDSMDNVLNPSVPSEILDATKDDSAQCSVNYTTVVSDPTLKHFQDGSGCSSCDEGNFSANNSDISHSSHGALWELESCKTGDSDQRHSGSYNSVEEMSESSDQEDDNKQETDLYYLTLNGEDSEEGEEETQNTLLKSIILSKENCSIPLLDTEEDSNEGTELLSAAPCGLTPLYLPQFRTAP